MSKFKKGDRVHIRKNFLDIMYVNTRGLVDDFINSADTYAVIDEINDGSRLGSNVRNPKGVFYRCTNSFVYCEEAFDNTQIEEILEIENIL